MSFACTSVNVKCNLSSRPSFLLSLSLAIDALIYSVSYFSLERIQADKVSLLNKTYTYLLFSRV